MPDNINQHGVDFLYFLYNPERHHRLLSIPEVGECRLFRPMFIGIPRIWIPLLGWFYISIIYSKYEKQKQMRKQMYFSGITNITYNLYNYMYIASLTFI